MPQQEWILLILFEVNPSERSETLLLKANSYFQIAKLFYDDFCESDFIIILHDCLLMTRNISSIADTRNTMYKSVRKFIAYDCARKSYLFTMTFLIVFIIILRDCHDKKYFKH